MKITSKMDLNDFDQRLNEETSLLQELFTNKRFKTEGLKAGAEIEFLILDRDYHLIPANLQFVEQVADKDLIPEAGASQLEINTKPLPLEADFLSVLHANMLKTWNHCCAQARANQQHLALIGAMPHAEKTHSEQGYITPESYFYLMDSYAKEYRNGSPLCISLAGENDSLFMNPPSLAVEGLISSFQLHLEVSQEESVKYYNIMQMISPYMVALGANAPFFYGKNLWSESRIPIFEQLYTFPNPMRKSVFFETDYARDSLFSLLKENKDKYLRLLPEVADYQDVNNLFHVKRQNSCVYRWNRPILDCNSNKEPTLRIEHRVLSTGPTVVDMVANAAFFYGLVCHFASQSVDVKNFVSARENSANFYEAAYFGMDARLMWNGLRIQAATVLKCLLPAAGKALLDLGIDKLDVDYYLKIIQRRIENRQNGSLWQQRYFAANPGYFDGLLGNYLENQYQEVPVGDWKK